MSGRIAALAAVHEGNRLTVYIGAASGGVWKSENGGTTYKPVFDKEPVQSIGAIAIDPTNPKVIWVGTGESWTRNSVSIGDGIYKSTDGGDNWTNMGLRESERIAKILIDPSDPNTVYACAPGKLWSDSEDRGVYKTTNGGQTWTKILKGSNPSTGCSMMSMDPKNPKTVYAGMWDFRRKGWTFRSGGDGETAPSASGLFKSTDGGATWSDLNEGSAKGLPAKPWGRVAVTVAPSNPNVVYAFIEAVPPKNALYRSSDGGHTWEMRDRSQAMVWRPFYFANLIVDPKDENRIFKPDGPLVVSSDGGQSFSGISNGAHGDFHDVWIDPTSTDRVITGDDGGVWYSYDGGNKWWKGDNLPISQFYHVSLDNDRPYHVYGGLQDNSSWIGDSEYPGGITNSRWENMYGGDGFWMFVDPTDQNYVYAEYQGGEIGRVNRKTHESRPIKPLPRYQEKKLRFNWNTPIHVSPTRNGTVYIGSQYLFRTRDFGQTWDRISPDPHHQRSGEAAPGAVRRRHRRQLGRRDAHDDLRDRRIAKGSERGLGGDRRRKSPGHPRRRENLDERRRQHCRAAQVGVGVVRGRGPFRPRHRLRDVRPAHLRRHAPVRVQVGGLRQDVDVARRGRQSGSRLRARDQAGSRQSESPLPRHRVRALDLARWWRAVVAVQGRRFPRRRRARSGDPSTRQRSRDRDPRPRHLDHRRHHAAPRAHAGDPGPGCGVHARETDRAEDSRAGGGWVNGDASFVGNNSTDAAVITYYLKKRHIFGDMKIEVLDASGHVVGTVPSTKRRGLSRVTWSMRLPPPRVPPAASAAFGAAYGPRVLPGTYTVKMTKDNQVYTMPLQLVSDPRETHTMADRQAQFALANKLVAMLGDMSFAVERMNGVRSDLEDRASRLPAGDPLAQRLRDASSAADVMRKKIVATKEGGMITGEERLRENLTDLYGAVVFYDGRPSQMQIDRTAAIGRELARCRRRVRCVVGKGSRRAEHRAGREEASADSADQPCPVGRSGEGGSVGRAGDFRFPTTKAKRERLSTLPFCRNLGNSSGADDHTGGVVAGLS